MEDVNAGEDSTIATESRAANGMIIREARCSMSRDRIDCGISSFDERVVNWKDWHFAEGFEAEHVKQQGGVIRGCSLAESHSRQASSIPYTWMMSSLPFFQASSSA